MDPLAHTLVGASLAETRLNRLTHLASPTLILGANAPDVDAVTMFISRDVSLGFRRGWTHGVLALVLLPLILAALVLLFDRVFAYARGQEPRGRPAPVMLLAYLGVLSHPFLDWLNTYGIRLLMPFDDRWFYGDALFVIDPWVWLLAGTSVVLAHSTTAVSKTAWLVLAVALTGLVTGVAGVPGAARLVWLVGASAVLGVRAWGGAQRHVARVAVGCLTCAALYIGLMLTGSRVAASQVVAWLSARDDTPVEIMAGPLPANPFVRDVVVADDEHYHFLEVDWWRDEPVQIASPAIERRPSADDPVVAAAIAAPQVQGLMRWIRFQAYGVETLPDGYRVTIRDVRYARRTAPGLGHAIVELDEELRVRSPR